MFTRLLVGLVVAVCVVAGAGSASADSLVIYPDSSVSEVFNLGGGVLALAFIDNPGDDDIFIHVFNGFGNLSQAFLGSLGAFAFWLDFEGFNQQFAQYGIYACQSFSNQTCTVSGTRRGTFFN